MTIDISARVYLRLINIIIATRTGRYIQFVIRDLFSMMSQYRFEIVNSKDYSNSCSQATFMRGFTSSVCTVYKISNWKYIQIQ